MIAHVREGNESGERAKELQGRAYGKNTDSDVAHFSHLRLVEPDRRHILPDGGFLVTNDAQNDPTIEEMQNADPVAQEFARKAEPISNDAGALSKLVSEWAKTHPPAKLDDMLESLRKADSEVSNRAVRFIAGWCTSELAAFYGRAVVKLRRSEVLAWARAYPDLEALLRAKAQRGRQTE